MYPARDDDNTVRSAMNSSDKSSSYGNRRRRAKM